MSILTNMPRDFIPWRDGDFLPFTANFGAKIAASPESYGISSERAAAYAVLQESFAQAYRQATDPSTATEPATAGKKAARKVLERETRMIARIVRGTRTVTSEMRINLGMNRRNGGGRSPRIPKPDAAPLVKVVSVIGRTVKIRLVDRESPTRRGKPRGVSTATIWTFIGEDPPADLNGWRWAGITSVTTKDVTFDDPTLVPGTKVWITARWENHRGEPGPGCARVYAYLQGGVMMAA